MIRQPARRTSLFLMELILAILLFSMASAICLLLFAKAHTLEADSRNLSHAVHACSSAAEIINSQEDPISYLQKMYPGGRTASEGTSFSLYYSKDWQICTSDEAAFVMEIYLVREDAILTGEISVMHQDTPSDAIFSLCVKKHVSLEVYP